MDLVRDKRVKDAYMNSTIQNMFDRGELRKDHPLQRKPDRWNKNDKDGLVATVIKDEDIDSIKVCEQLIEQGVVLWVIDGLQRLTVLSSYRNGGFKIGRNIEFPIITYQATKRDKEGNILKNEYGNYTYETVEYDLRGKGYADLPVELKEKYDNYKIDVVKHLDCTNDEIGYHIRRYNKQKSMNGSENAVTYMDNIAGEVKKISVNNRFLNGYDIYTATEINNGTINRIVTETVMCMFHFDSWQKQSKKMGLFLNEHSSKEEFDKLNENLNRLENIYTEEFNEIFTSKDSFIWFTLFHKFTGFQLEDKKFGEFLLAFKNGLCNKKVHGELFYGIDKNGSTKDKAIIMKKLNLLESLMLDFLHINKSDIKEDNVLEFLKKNVNQNITQEDVEQYEEVLEDLTLNVDNSSELLNKNNKLSLMAMVAYSFCSDVDLDNWIVDFFKRNTSFISNQKENYIHMKKDLERFVSSGDMKSAYKESKGDDKNTDKTKRHR